MSWQDHASCSQLSYLFNSPENEVPEKRSILYYFFEGYEQNDEVDPRIGELVFGDHYPKTIRSFTERICNSCPVQEICLEYGKQTSSTGVWGGKNLTRGRVKR